MGILWMDTADLRSTGRWSSVTSASGNAISISSAQARTGNYSYLSTNATNTIVLRRNLPATPSTIYVKSGIFMAQQLNGVYHTVLFENAGVHLRIYYDTGTGGVWVYRDGTFLGGNSTVGLVQNEWYCVEIKAVIHDTAGEVSVRINGETVIELTSVDTRNGGAGVVTAVGWQSMGGISARNWYIDDIVVRDDNWPGRGGVLMLVPDAAGDEDDWSALSGNAHDAVAVLPPSFANYIAADADAAGAMHLFGIEELASPAAAIAGVGVVAYARLDASGSGAIRNLLKAGTELVHGGDSGLDVSGRWIDDAYWEQNPDDSQPWETADIDGLQIGVETR